MKLYTDYVKEKMLEMIGEAGGINALARKIGVDKAYVSKAANGKIIPAPKTFGKWIGKDISAKLYIEEQ